MPVFALFPGICLTAEEKSWQNLSQGSRKVPKGTIDLIDFTAVRQATSSGLLTPWLGLQVTQVNLLSAQVSAELLNDGFSTSANFESKLKLRVLMWSTKNETLRFSSTCLVFMYQVGGWT